MDLCKTILTRGVHVLSLSDSITALRVPPARPVLQVGASAMTAKPVAADEIH